jgi:hypothetical protein
MGTIYALNISVDDHFMDRLHELEAELERAFAEAMELREAAADDHHRLNTWPYLERRASPRRKAR